MLPSKFAPAPMSKEEHPASGPPPPPSGTSGGGAQTSIFSHSPELLLHFGFIYQISLEPLQNNDASVSPCSLLHLLLASKFVQGHAGASTPAQPITAATSFPNLWKPFGLHSASLSPGAEPLSNGFSASVKPHTESLSCWPGAAICLYISHALL